MSLKNRKPLVIRVPEQRLTLQSCIPCLRSFRCYQRVPQVFRSRPQGRHQARERRVCIHVKEQSRRDGELVYRPQGQGRGWEGSWREANRYYLLYTLCQTQAQGESIDLLWAAPENTGLQGLTSSSTVSLSLSDEEFGKLVSGKANAQRLFMSGKLKVKGDVMKATKMEPILKKAQGPKAKL